jgi:regulatory protein
VLWRSAPSLKARALQLLAAREHSRKELKRKLSRHAEEGEDIDGLLDDFEKRGWLSEARFIEQAVRTGSRKYGALKIVHQLREKGVGEEGIAAGMRLASTGERETLAAVWRSRFGTPPQDAAQKAKHIRFLQGRGFRLEDIVRFLRETRSASP